jgi:hypothetical protein
MLSTLMDKIDAEIQKTLLNDMASEKPAREGGENSFAGKLTRNEINADVPMR